MSLKLAAAIGTVVGALAIGAGTAPAQTVTTYQGLCTTASGTIDAGAHNIGTTFTVVLAPQCAWTPGTAVAVTVNGASVGTKVASPAGTISVTVTVVSATQVSIDDPVAAPAHCGSGNTIVGTAPSSVANGSVSETATFTVLCPASTATPVSGGVAFTGANIARSVAVAALLMSIGLAIVTVTRRRRTASPS